MFVYEMWQKVSWVWPCVLFFIFEWILFLEVKYCSAGLRKKVECHPSLENCLGE